MAAAKILTVAQNKLGKYIPAEMSEVFMRGVWKLFFPMGQFCSVKLNSQLN